MTESERLAEELDKALNGGAWHGPSWREALEGVSRQAALGRPIPEAHSIAEIVLHATTWHDVVRRRLEGETPQVPDAEDWPPADLPEDDVWSAVLGRLFESGRALCETVRRFPAERLLEQRPRVDDTWFALISGELQHVLYHAGQIAVLKKSTGRV
ncbi:MAG: hypothetical protein A2W00_06200 [Candidatus Eisenbacteria bacterium RBG_16_71_46]|nr:MAG: hypothetical protein A2W00_06200 [Candidatus Eisenbacteria bacterium RBG_16_71_46]OGF21691.1 MAG: hypothetical protein A2V63_11655 [Candidatus Eisenbacteria bacterium RBG_19FT_COMBO_70_11]